MDKQKTAFISYRRSNSSYIARGIFKDLVEHDYDVFMDVESINGGEFDRIILRQIAARAHFIIILAPGSLERCKQPNDWLRREIETAIETGRNIIPIMANGFKFSDNEDKLIGKLVTLKTLDSLPLYHEYFECGMDRLRERYLNVKYEVDLHEIDPNDTKYVLEIIEKLMKEPTPTQDELSAEEFRQRAFSRDTKDFEGKIRDYTDAIRIDPNLARAYHGRGVVRRRAGDIEGALKDFEKALKLDENLELTYFSRGRLYYDQANYVMAVVDFQKLLELNPTDDSGLNLIAICYRYLEDFDQAIFYHKRAATLNPKAYRYRALGKTYILSGQYESALEAFYQAERIAPGHHKNIGIFAILYQAIEQNDFSRRLWNLLLGLDSRYYSLKWATETLSVKHPKLKKMIQNIIIDMGSSEETF